MLRRRLDGMRPTALALAELGGDQQLAQGQDAGERGADLVSEIGEARLDARGSRCGGRPARCRFGAPLTRGLLLSAHVGPGPECHAPVRPATALTSGRPRCGYPLPLHRLRAAPARPWPASTS